MASLLCYCRKIVNQFDNWYFKVEYLTEDDVKMSVSKHLPTNVIHNTLVDNQTQPFVDVRLQAKVEADKIIG